MSSTNLKMKLVDRRTGMVRRRRIRNPGLFPIVTATGLFFSDHRVVPDRRRLLLKRWAITRPQFKELASASFQSRAFTRILCNAEIDNLPTLEQVKTQLAEEESKSAQRSANGAESRPNKACRRPPTAGAWWPGIGRRAAPYQRSCYELPIERKCYDAASSHLSRFAPLHSVVAPCFDLAAAFDLRWHQSSRAANSSQRNNPINIGAFS